MGEAHSAGSWISSRSQSQMAALTRRWVTQGGGNGRAWGRKGPLSGLSGIPGEGTSKLRLRADLTQDVVRDGTLVTATFAADRGLTGRVAREGFQCVTASPTLSGTASGSRAWRL